MGQFIDFEKFEDSFENFKKCFENFKEFEKGDYNRNLS